MTTRRRYGYAMDERACQMLGQDPAQRTVVDLSVYVPILTGGDTLIDKMSVLIEERHNDETPTTTRDLHLSARCRPEKMAMAELPDGYAYASVADIETGANLSYVIMRVEGLAAVPTPSRPSETGRT